MSRFDPLTLSGPLLKNQPTRAQIEVLPTLADVLYEPPAPTRDPQSKACSNCALWSSSFLGRCALFRPDRVIFGWDVCGFHVPGKPRKHRLPVYVDPPLDPDLAGLIVAVGGTSCGSCRWFRAENGRCLRVREEDRAELAKVDPFGCCTRWRSR